MIKPIGPQYIAAQNSRRVGLTHASKVINRLMRIYGLDDELQEQQEIDAAAMQAKEFTADEVAIAPALPAMAVTQNTFSWFE